MSNPSVRNPNATTDLNCNSMTVVLVSLKLWHHPTPKLGQHKPPNTCVNVRYLPAAGRQIPKSYARVRKVMLPQFWGRMVPQFKAHQYYCQAVAI